MKAIMMSALVFSTAANAAGREEISFAGKRIRYVSTHSVDRVLAQLAAGIGKTVPPEKLSSLGKGREEYESAVKASLGPQGFLSVARLDYTELMTRYGAPRRIVRWMIGNPLIAITMLKPDPSAALFAPVEILVMEEKGGGSSVTFVLPSSQIVVRENEPLAKAAKGLDEKLEALVAGAVE